MGNAMGGPGGPPGGDPKKGDKKPQKKKFETRAGGVTRKKRMKKGPTAAQRLPTVTPVAKCKLRMLKLERVKDFLLLEQEFIQNQERLRPKEEKDAEERSKVDELRGTPMAVGSLEEMIDDNHAIVSSSNGPDYYVNVLSFVNPDLLEPGASILMHQKTNSIVGVLGDDADPMVSVMKVDKAPLESYADIGGLETQIQEMKEAVELPLTHPEARRRPFHHRLRCPTAAPLNPHPSAPALVSPLPPPSAHRQPSSRLLPPPHPPHPPLTAPRNETTRPPRQLYEDIGIRPPKGVILYGEPGTGKTLLAKAVANQTSATFLRVTGSELIQKYLGDGPKLVRELFRVAEEHAPTIVFIDEIDSVGTKRYDSSSGGEREIQRTMLELLNQLDGFDARTDVKVILATNKIETLDPALIRPGRIDRKIEFPAPDQKTRRHIFQIHTSKMNLADDVNLEEFIMSKDELSGADIKAMCTEAGLLALRERRMKVSHAEFKKARDYVMFKKKEGAPEGLYL